MNHNPQAATIHTATADDVATLVTLAQALSDELGQACLLEHARIAAALAPVSQPRCHAFVAKVQGEAIGFVLFYAGFDLTTTSNGFHVADIYVVPSGRGAGIGRQLMQAVAQEAVAQGREWISLTVLSHNAAASAFYDRLGFVQAEVGLYALGHSGILSLS